MDGNQLGQRQTGVNTEALNSGSMSLPFISAALKPEKDNKYMSWAHTSQDDPYKLYFTQTSIINRKPTDKADCDSEADLQGLVSNIVDEADSRDSFFSESLPTCNPFWSPKTQRGELLQNLKTEAKMLSTPSFPSNHLSHETFSKAKQHSTHKLGDQPSLESSGLAGNQPWLFSLPNSDNHSLLPQKLPPGLPLPKMMNPSQMQQIKRITMLPYIDRGNDQPLNSFTELSDSFRPQNGMNVSSFDDFYEDQYAQSNVNSVCKENYLPENVNQLVSRFQLFMPREHDSICHEEFPNVHKQTLSLPKEQGLAEQWNITGPAVTAQSSPAVQTQKQLLEDLGSVQRGRIREVRKNQFKLDAFQELHNFNSQNTEYFQKPQELPSHLNLTNHHQNKMAMQRENFNLRMNQYIKHQMIQQSQMQAKVKSQLEREKKMQMSGFLGEGNRRRQQPNAYMMDRAKHPTEQNPYFDFQGNMQCQRLNGENTVVCAGNPQQFTPRRYPVSDLRRYSSTTTNSNFNSRSSLVCGNGVPGMNKSGMMSAKEPAAFTSVISDMTTYRGKNPSHGRPSAMTASLTMNQGGPVMQLYFYLDKCQEQWRFLEKDRNKAEITLKKVFPGKRTTVMINTNLPRTPPNPTRLDQLIVNLMSEQAKVSSLLNRTESLCSISLHVNIHSALKNHHMAVCVTQARYQVSRPSLTKTQQQRFNFTEERDNVLMAVVLKDLSAATRRLRTALWCALQTTLPKPVIMKDHHADEESACTERFSFLLQGYSFRI